MGFELYKPLGVIQFDEASAYAGAEVTVRLNVPEAEFRAFVGAQDAEAEWQWFREKALVSWNLTDNEEPIPLDADVPTNFRLGVMRAWLGEARGIPAPLARRSPAGAP